MGDISTDILLIVLAGLLGGVLASFLRMPLLIGYLLAGLLVGPHTMGPRVTDLDAVGKLADIGAALLLFSLGLEFPLKSLKQIRNVAFFGSAIQVVLTFLFCWFLGRQLGLDTAPSMWFAAAFLSSSTAVILKTLANQGYAGALSGRIMLGMSIVQDLTVIPVMILLTNYSRASGSTLEFLLPLIYAGIFVLLMGVLGSKLMPRLLQFVAKLHSRELFLLVVTALALGIGYLTSRFGLSLAFGAFVAGMVLSESDYSLKAQSELGPLRDLFVLIFFVSVGMLCDPVFLWENFGTVLGVLLAATLMRGALLFGVTYAFGYRRVIPFAAFFGMLPVSEIAFVLIRQGIELQTIDHYVYSLLLNVTVLSMLIGPPLSRLTTPCFKLMRRFHPEKRTLPRRVNFEDGDVPREVVLTGDPAVANLAALLQQLGRPFILVEPQYKNFVQYKRLGFPAIFGDPAQEMILDSAGIRSARVLVVVSSSSPETRGVVQMARQMNPDLPIILQLENGAAPAVWAKESGITVVEVDRAAGVETVRMTLLALGWSMSEIFRCLQKASSEVIGKGAELRDRHGVPFLSQFFGTAELTVKAGSRWDGCPIAASGFREEYGLLVLGVARSGKFSAFPDRDFVLHPDDRVMLIGEPHACDEFCAEGA